MPDERQIDVQLRITGEGEVASLVAAMKELKDTMGKIEGKDVGHQTFDGSTSSMASRPIGPQEQPKPTNQFGYTLGPQPPENRGKAYNLFSTIGVGGGASRAAQDDPGNDLGQGGMGGGPSRGSSGFDPTARWWQNQLRGQLDEPIQMPRFGEFTAQDTLNMMSNVLGKGGDKLAKSGGTQGPSAGASTTAAAMGGTAGLLNIAQTYSPYAARLQQATGLNLTQPRALQSLGQSSGLDRATGFPAQIGIGGFGMQIPGSQFFGEAGASGLQQNLRAIGQGLGPGISTLESQEMQGALRQLGWSDDKDLGSLSDIYSSVKGEGQAMPEVGTTASIIDQSVRYGQGSPEELKQFFSDMGDAAQGARMSLDDFAKGVDEAANTLQGKGLSYDEGKVAAQNLSGVIDMPPQTIGPIMDSPFWQANAMGRTGLMPESQGYIANSPGLFTDVTLQTLKQQVGAYQGGFSDLHQDIKGAGGATIGSGNLATARQQAIAQAAPNLGMTPEQANLWMKRGPILQKQSNISTALDAYGTASKLRPESTASPQGLPKSDVSWPELKKMMEEHGTKIDQGFIDQMQGESPADRTRDIRKELNRIKPDLTDPSLQHKLDLTPWAKRLVIEQGHGPRSKTKDKNQGATTANEQTDTNNFSIGRGALGIEIPVPSPSKIVDSIPHPHL